MKLRYFALAALIQIAIMGFSFNSFAGIVNASAEADYSLGSGPGQVTIYNNGYANCCDGGAVWYYLIMRVQIWEAGGSYVDGEDVVDLDWGGYGGISDLSYYVTGVEGTYYVKTISLAYTYGYDNELRYSRTDTDESANFLVL